MNLKTLHSQKNKLDKESAPVTPVLGKWRQEDEESKQGQPELHRHPPTHTHTQNHYFKNQKANLKLGGIFCFVLFLNLFF